MLKRGLQILGMFLAVFAAGPANAWHVGSPTYPIQGPVRLGDCGDSISQNGVVLSTGYASNNYTTSVSFYAWAMRYTAGRLIWHPDFSAAVSAQSEPNVIAYQVPALLSGNAVDLIACMVGTNQIINTPTYATLQALDQQIQNMVVNNGKKLLWISILPRTSETTAQTTLRRQINAWRASQANNSTIFYLNLVPQVSATDDGNTYPNIYQTDGQGVHPNQYLAQQLGIAIASWVNTNVGPPLNNGQANYGYAGGTWSAGNPQGNLLNNPSFSGASGTLNNTLGAASSSTLPTNWTATRKKQSDGTATTAIDAAITQPQAGQLQFVLSGTGGGAEIQLDSNNSLSSGFVIGSYQEAEIDITWSGLTGIDTIQLYAGAGAFGVDGNYSNVTGTQPLASGQSGSGTWRIPFTKITNPSTTFTLLIVSDPNSTSVGGTITLSNPRQYVIPNARYAQLVPSLASKSWRLTFDGTPTGNAVGLSELAAMDVITSTNIAVGAFNQMNSVYSSNANSAGFNALFDGNTSTTWNSTTADAASPKYVEYDFGTPVNIKQVQVTSDNDASYSTISPVSGTWQYRDNLTGSWTTYFSYTASAWGQATTQTYTHP